MRISKAVRIKPVHPKPNTLTNGFNSLDNSLVIL